MAACADTDRNGNPLDTTTAGRVKISVDETLQPVIGYELDDFHALYSKAHIDAHFLPESQAIQTFLRDTMRVVVAARKLTKQENDFFEQKKIHVRTTTIAYDAIAFIVNTDNADSILSVSQLKSIFTGQISTWKQLNPSLPDKPLNVVFDNAGSSTLNFLRQYLKLESDTLPANFFAQQTNPQVIDYVKKNPGAIGVIGVNWISNYKDSGVVEFMKDIRVLGLNPPDTAKKYQEYGSYFQPTPGFIALRWYPLVREVYIHSRELWAGLGTGFASFVAGDKGQLIIYHAGLVPATMPVRMVNVKKSL
jgi:phosphate transport system substrate-binding protein